MKILFVSSFFPYPPDEGIKMPAYNLIKQFTLLGHKVVLLSLIKKGEERYVSFLKEITEKIFVVEHKISKSILKRLFSFFYKEPFNTYQFYSQKFLTKIKEVISLENPDIVFFDFFTTVRYRQNLDLKIPTILHYHDAVSMLFYRNFILEKNFFSKIYWYSQFKKLLNFEYKLQSLFDKIVVVAQKDKDWLLDKSKLTSNKIEVIPNGVDVDYFYYKFNKKFNEEPYSILFRGIMNFKPNIDACLYFLKEIYPLLKKEIPQIKFYIVGPNPPKTLFSYAKKDRSIIITGYVEDIREYIIKCKINVCPMISGSGIKNKILESLAMGTPSVITSVASEGIPELKHKENVLIADNVENFVESIKMLFYDKNLYIKISQNGRKLIEEKYTWQLISAKFCKVLEELI